MTVASAQMPLPDYANPPVVETVLGVQFDRLPGFTNAHLGAFWKTLDAAEWPTVSDAPPLEPQFERFDEAARWFRALQVELIPIPAGRLQIRNKASDRMIQVQNTRFHFNWLGAAGTVYPHYEKLRAEFDEVFRRFAHFIADAKVGDLQPNQWEVSYFNNIPRGTVWNTPSDWGFFRPIRLSVDIPNVVQGESFTGEWHFVIPEQRGRLHIEWQHGVKAAAEQEERELVRLTLTARGPVAKEGGMKAAVSGLELGRETIVRTFAALMSTEANKYWGLKNAND